LRIRVSMSAMGSVMVIFFDSSFLSYPWAWTWRNVFT